MLESEAVVARERWVIFLTELKSNLKLLKSEGESEAILKQLDRHERRLERRQKCSEDFLRYIQYCMDLMNLLNERRLKQKVKKQKYTKYEKFITQMINKAFRIFVFRNQGDFDMWKAFLDFNKLKSSPDYVSKLYLRLLKVNSLSVQFWIEAAEWELEQKKDFDSCRKIYQRALELFPQDNLMWSKYIQMEIIFTNKIREDENFAKLSLADVSRIAKVSKGALVQEVINEAKNHSIDLKFIGQQIEKHHWLEEILNKDEFVNDSNENVISNQVEKSKGNIKFSETLEQLKLIKCSNFDETVAFIQSNPQTTSEYILTSQLLKKFTRSHRKKLSTAIIELDRKVSNPEFTKNIVKYYLQRGHFIFLSEIFKKYYIKTTQKSLIAIQILNHLCAENRNKIKENCFELEAYIISKFIDACLKCSDANIWIHIIQFVRKNSDKFSLDTLDSILILIRQNLSSQNLNLVMKSFNAFA